MAKLGATLNESIAAISAIASDRASATHPAKKTGWHQLPKDGTVLNQMEQATLEVKLVVKLAAIRVVVILETLHPSTTQAG